MTLEELEKAAFCAALAANGKRPTTSDLQHAIDSEARAIDESLDCDDRAGALSAGGGLLLLLVSLFHQLGFSFTGTLLDLIAEHEAQAPSPAEAKPAAPPRIRRRKDGAA